MVTSGLVVRWVLLCLLSGSSCLGCRPRFVADTMHAHPSPPGAWCGVPVLGLSGLECRLSLASDGAEVLWLSAAVTPIPVPGVSGVTPLPPPTCTPVYAFACHRAPRTAHRLDSEPVQRGLRLPTLDPAQRAPAHGPRTPVQRGWMSACPGPRPRAAWLRIPEPGPRAACLEPPTSDSHAAWPDVGVSQTPDSTPDSAPDLGSPTRAACLRPPPRTPAQRGRVPVCPGPRTPPPDLGFGPRPGPRTPCSAPGDRLLKIRSCPHPPHPSTGKIHITPSDPHHR
ncbi:hypothetical protein CLV43_1011160 [Umezawaea tangerina]|uniref:Uncharacterized protein n=1 Tax=Umezawaea tangerina TaxID=84725 RepID=A0A2T0TMK0_9PSEU|nr:hypothetical protein CLV43_1011160 [Umezawaea tangerina]